MYFLWLLLLFRNLKIIMLLLLLLFFPMQLLSMMLVAYDRLLLVPLLDLFFSMVVNVGALFAEIIVVGVVFMAVAKETVVVSFNLRQK